MNLRRVAFFLLSGFLLLFFAGCQAPRRQAAGSGIGHLREDTFVRYTLPNGLTVVIAPIEGVKVSAVQVWVNAGSIYEKKDEYGITHLIEHMIFKGTEKRGVGQIASEIESLGGSINAFTSFDHTVYHVTIKSDATENAVEILSDAVFNSSFDARELEKEQEVVAEEIRRSLDNPPRRLGYALFENAYPKSPYGHRIIGTIETVKSISRDMILEYTRKWYVPDNMCVVVAGDVETARARRWVAEYFGGVQRPGGPVFYIQNRAERTEPVGVQLSENVKQARFALAYPAPKLSHPDIPALDVLSMILGEGESSRLFSTLYHDRELVYAVSATSFTPKGQGLFFITANLSPAKLKDAFRATLEIIKEVQETGVSLEELGQAKRVLTTDFLTRRESAQGEAEVLGYFQLLWGDAAKRRQYLESIDRLTPGDVKRVAKEYLDPSKLTLVVQAPRRTKEGLARSLAEDALAYAPSPVLPGEFEKVGAVTRTVLTNGVTVLVQQEKRLPVVSFTLALKGGLLAEKERLEGISNLMVHMLTQGTNRLGAQEFARKVEEMAGSLRGFSGRNSFGLEGSFLARDFEAGLELAAGALLRPAFSQAELNKLKTVMQAEIKTEDERPASFTMRRLFRLLYENHPYGLNRLGRKESIENIDRARLMGFHSSLVQPENLVIGMVGDVEPEYASRVAARLFGGMKQGKNVRPLDAAAPGEPKEPRRKAIHKKAHQTHIALGFLGAKVPDEDRFPLKVLTHVLAGQGGRLFRTLRDEMSLAYALTSFSFEGLDRGAVVLYLACAPDKEETAIKALYEQIEQIKKGVSPGEVERARNYILGNYLDSVQSFSERAQTIALNELYGLGADYQEHFVKQIETVTPGQVVEVAEKYLDIEHSALVTLGPKE